MIFFELLFRISKNRVYRWNPHPLKMGDLAPNQNFNQNVTFPKLYLRPLLVPVRPRAYVVYVPHVASYTFFMGAQKRTHMLLEFHDKRMPHVGHALATHSVFE